MTICTLYDLRQDEDAKRYITRRCLEAMSSQERALLDLYNKHASIIDTLESLAERGDITLLIQLPEGDFAGYALLTEHKNTWTGAAEGFIYALDVKQQLLYTPLVQEFLEAIRQWGIGRGYPLLRVVVPEGRIFQPLIAYLQSLGWVTSCLVPYKILSSSLEPTDMELILHHDDEIHIRMASEKDYPFVFQLLAEATWSGLSPFEKSLLDCETLVKNICQDFEPMLNEGTAWSLVAETVREGLCAHATVLQGTHNLLDIPEAELVDTFVLPTYGGRRLGSKLTAHVLAKCLNQGIHLVCGSLVAESTSEESVQRVRLNLEQMGWWMSSRIMYWDIVSSK